MLVVDDIKWSNPGREERNMGASWTVVDKLRTNKKMGKGGC